jgi:hypothetical protein
MKRRRILLILLGSVAAITFAIFFWPREREPEYDGVSLSLWLKASRNYRKQMLGIPHRASPLPQYPVDGSKADSAIRHIGTNALPFLVRWIQYEPPAWRRSVDRIAFKLPPTVLNNRPARWLLADNKSDLADRAVTGFAFLGTNATAVLPELQRLAKNASKPRTQDRAEVAIALVNMFDGEGNEITNR